MQLLNGHILAESIDNEPRQGSRGRVITCAKGDSFIQEINVGDIILVDTNDIEFFFERDDKRYFIVYRELVVAILDEGESFDWGWEDFIEEDKEIEEKPENNKKEILAAIEDIYKKVENI